MQPDARIRGLAVLKRAYRKTKVMLKVLVGQELLVRTEHACRTEHLGSDYGGWTICPDFLNADSTVYSLGVGEDITFDLELISRFGMTIHGFDPTPSSIQWISAQSLPEQFVMHSIAISDFDGDGEFIPPVDPRFFAHTLAKTQRASPRTIPVPVKSLGSVMRSLGHHELDLLKMDIEGSEYEVIADLRRSDIRPRQLLVEFHHRFPGIGPEKTRVALQQLREMGYRLFAISDNHQEYSFIRLT